MKRVVQFIFIIGLLLSSGYIAFYYWTINSVESLRNLPTTLLTALIVYIAIQLVKRLIKRKIEWYDWLYYIGLVAVLLPLLFIGVSSDWIFDVTKYGSLFLVLPPLIDLLKIIGASK